MQNTKIHIDPSSIPLQMVVAMDDNGGIGNSGKLPWPHSKKDMQLFQKLTKDAVVIMGRKTYEEIEEIRLAKDPEATELLPGRVCVVVSSRNISTKMNISVVKTLMDAIKYYYEDNKSIVIMGGLQLYIEALPYVKHLHVTQFKKSFECDRFLPLPYLARHFRIVAGTQDEEAVYLTCDRVVL